jgi:hypothetical protein
MGIATGLLVGGAIVKGVTSAIGAHKQANAAKDAAKMQTDAADKAAGINDSIYKPYVQQASSVRGTLGRLTTPGGGARYAAADPGAPPQAPPSMGNGARVPPPGAPRSGPAVPRTLGGMVNKQMPGGMQAPGGPPQQPMPGGGGGMALIEAPDGSGVRPVPIDQVDRFVKAGGKRVG